MDKWTKDDMDTLDNIMDRMEEFFLQRHEHESKAIRYRSRYRNKATASQ